MTFLRRIFFLLLLSSAINISPTRANKEDVVCGTVDIRKSEEINKLENCTVVNGNVVLILGHIGSYEDKYTSEQINNWTFPLREITGFLLIHAVMYLDSLSSIFPNLTIIRGQKLFTNYAFVIYETNLKEIGLPNLLRISRGSVRIDGDNDRLCLPKIDWESIIQLGKIVIGKNMTSCDDQCKKCPKTGYCWNKNTCQRFEQSPSFTTDRKQCHDLCIGDCVDETAKGCFVCKDLSEDFKCVEHCSSERYLNIDSRRCVTAIECIESSRKIHGSECLQDCPAGFNDKLDYNDETKKLGYCKPCPPNKCPRICNVPEIRTVAQLEMIGVGCTIINGSLEIRMMEDVSNLTAELQTYLGNVEEIHGNLKIHRSNAITTLTFLNNLKIVLGTQNSSSTNVSTLGLFNSIRIFENANLQNIFDWKQRGDKKLVVKHGEVLIYNNVRLCEDEVNNFVELIQMKAPIDKMKKIRNNGYRKKCKNDHIKTRFQVLSYDKCEIIWTDSSVKKDDNLPIYLIQYVPITNFGVKEVVEQMLFEKDACSKYGWVNVITKQENIKIENGTMKYILKNLLQYTDYAYTVQQFHDDTSFASVKNHTGASDAKFFKTEMLRPSRVINFQTSLKSHNFISLDFNVLQNEQSAVDKFILHTFKRDINVALIDRRDYCLHPIDNQDIEENSAIADTITEMEENLKCCKICCKSNEPLNEPLKLDGVLKDDFKKSLVKFSDSERRKNSENHVLKMEKSDGFVKKDIFNGTSRTFTIYNLKPFTFYNFHIYACTADAVCSEYEMLFDKTAYDENYDRIKFNSFSRDFKSNKYIAYFEEPSLKNGAILSYTIEIREINGNHSRLLFSKCITRKQHEKNGYSYTIDNLNRGNYSYRVMANSLAGNGLFSDFHYFEIFDSKNNGNEISWRWIIIGIFGFAFLLTSIGVAYYYKHKILILLKRQDDSSVLMKDVDDFINVSSSRCDNLSDIIENDEEGRN